nr:hypothetical protein [Tanacetum cinerariifolium]
EAGFQLNVEQADWRDDTDDEPEDQELEAHYIEHPEQSKSVNDTYPIEQDEHNVIIDSLDMSYNREQIDHDDDDDDLTNEHDLLDSLIEKLKCEIDDSKNRNKFLETSSKIDQNDDDADLVDERELLASLIEKLKCEIDEIKNCNKFLETSNKVLIEKLKGQIEDFKNKNKSLESSNNYFKEANNKLSEINNLLYTDFKKSQAELVRRNDVEYASKKEAQLKLYKTREDNELDKVIALENKVKEKMMLCKQEEARIQLNAEQANWRDDTDDELEDQELEVHYMYMAQLQKVYLDATNSGSIFDTELVQKVSTDDHYNVFAIKNEH